MKKLSFILIGVFFTCILIADDNNISVQIVWPEEGAISGYVLNIAAKITSSNDIKDVIAQVEDRKENLQEGASAFLIDRMGQPGWSIDLSLLGLSKGQKTLSILATDIYGNQVEEQRSFIYSDRPSLIITEPIDYSVARPLMQISALCPEIESDCSLEVTHQSGMQQFLITMGKSSINENVSLAYFDGGNPTLKFKAMDSGGQYFPEETRIVIVESSTKLDEIETVNGPIWDVDSDRILFVDIVEDNDILKIKNRLTGEESIIMDDKDYTLEFGYLAPRGTIFAATNRDTNRPYIYDFRDGILENLGKPASLYSLKAKGNYAVWVDWWDENSSDFKTPVILYNLQNGNKETVSEDGGTLDVASNGDVVYTKREEGAGLLITQNIFRFRNGVTERITNDWGEIKNGSPLTDGKSIVYIKYVISSPDWEMGIAMYGPEGEEILAPLRPERLFISPGDDYQINNGWIAYKKENQIWLLSPTGETKQIIAFLDSTDIDFLSPDGEVTIKNSFNTHLGSPDDSLIVIGGTSLYRRTFFQNSQWFYIIGRSLFNINKESQLSITVTPSSHNFGLINSGSSSEANTFNISNIGDEDINIGSISILGPNASSFSVLNDYCSGQVLSPFESKAVDIIFSPVSQGLKTALLLIPSSDPNKNPFEIPIHGGLRSTNVLLISGSVKTDQSEEIEGATISLYDDYNKQTTFESTDIHGSYIYEVRRNFSGDIEPYFPGFIFLPPKRIYAFARLDQMNQDFIGVEHIYAPSNFIGKKELNRSLYQTEYINDLSWEANSANKNIVNYRIYYLQESPPTEKEANISRERFKIMVDRKKEYVNRQSDMQLLIELNANTFEYWHRNLERNKEYTYSLVAVDDQGREGEAAYVSIK